MGITPACAGKSSVSDTLHALQRDHPRVCGEKCRFLVLLALFGRITPACAGKRPLSLVWMTCETGSPPRVRGKVWALFSQYLNCGITPACAGKSILPSATRWPRRDHPRVCGEKFENLMGQNDKTGSPPRVRGKAGLVTPHAPCKRITPACAGKSALMPAVMAGSQDHPRVCGEKINWYNLTGLVLGSPPRVRGKAFDAGKLIPFYGITPACAGKSLICGFLLPRSGDHPRVCGEKLIRLALPDFLQGSPPRVRGKVCHPHLKKPFPGITPACAGKREPPPAFRACGRDHPRVCGEKTLPD